MKIKSGGCIYRLHNRIFYTKEEVNLDEYEILVKIINNEDYYELITNEYNKDENGNISTLNSAWFLLKKYKIDEKLNKYKLHLGDIIKIGRIITRIKEIKYSNKNTKKFDDEKSQTNSIVNNSKISDKLILKDIGDLINEKEVTKSRHKVLSLANQRNATDPNLGDRIQVLTLNNNNKIINNDNEKDNNDKNTINKDEIEKKSSKKKNNIIKKKNFVCRICYCEEEDEKEDPLVQPCQCSGSLKYIHLKCLKHWIITRSCIKVEENDCCSVFLFKEVECEICKAKLPDLINHKGKLFSLLDFSDEFKSYLILETLTLDEENNKFLYIISHETNRQMKIGRGTLSEILLSDVSVSRIHCLLSIEGKNIYIQDNNSKFGTLVLIQTPIIKFAENLPLYIQVGRTFLNFVVKKDSNFFSCCDVFENPNKNYHYSQNEKQVKLNRIITVKNEKYNESEEDDDEEDIKEGEKNENQKIDVKSSKSDKEEDNSIKIVIDND